MPASPVTVTDQTFGEVVQQYPLVVVDAWAPWCGPCRYLGPVLDQIARDMAGQLVIGKLNVDENPAVPMAFGIRGIPTMLVFRDGKHVDTIVGAAPAETLRARFAAYLR